MQTFINLKKTRKVQRKSPKKDTNTKLTRRVYLGWKHEIKPGIYKLIPASKGGGQQILDVHKDLDYCSLHKEVRDIFFPNGISQAQNLKIEEIKSHLASFSGSNLPNFDDEGGFTVGKYFRNVKSCPVRMYLHTQRCVCFLQFKKKFAIGKCIIEIMIQIYISPIIDLTATVKF